MENSYNARVSFKGEGNFTFVLPKYGEITIYAGKDLYIKGLSVSGVEALRELRPLLLEHKLNAKPDGCYKVIDLNSINLPKYNKFERAYVEPAKSVADLKAEMIKGPITKEVEKPVEKVVEAVVEEPEVKEIVKEEIEKPVKEAKKILGKKSNKKNKRK